MVWEGAPAHGQSRAASRLVLHFDINKTIIMCDPVKGVDCEMMVNSLLAEACWGTWDEAAHGHAVGQTTDGPKLPAAASWTPGLRAPQAPTPLITPLALASHFAAIHKTETYSPEQVDRPSGMVSYSELLEGVLEVTKTARVHLKTRFTEPGQPGEIYRPDYERLIRALSLPPGVELPHAPNAIGKGRRFIIPSFFELVLALERAERDFSIVFRTFGVDLADVADEWNSFCTGEHPCYPGVQLDGSGSSGIDRTLTLPDDSGAWYRYGDGDADAADKVTLSLVDGTSGFVVVSEGAAACAQAIDAKLRDPHTATLGLQDYYPHWARQNESDAAGKLLLVDTSPDAVCHHIFFDDNIERDRAHIVDCRDSRTGESLPYTSTRGRWLVKAEPLHSIVDTQYFIRTVRSCEAALSPRAPGRLQVDGAPDQADAQRRLLQATRMQIAQLHAELGLLHH